MWQTPVFFVHETWGLTRVNSSVEALRILDSWRQKPDGPAYREVINVCIEAVQGERLHEDARLAFLMALTKGGLEIEAGE